MSDKTDVFHLTYPDMCIGGTSFGFGDCKDFEELIITGGEGVVPIFNRQQAKTYNGLYRHLVCTHHGKGGLFCPDPVRNYCTYVVLTLEEDGVIVCERSESMGTTSFVTSTNQAFRHYLTQLLFYSYEYEKKNACWMYLFDRGQINWQQKVLYGNYCKMILQTAFQNSRSVCYTIEDRKGCLTCGARIVNHNQGLSPCISCAHDVPARALNFEMRVLPRLLMIEAMYCRKSIFWYRLTNTCLICKMENRQYRVVIISDCHLAKGGPGSCPVHAVKGYYRRKVSRLNRSGELVPGEKRNKRFYEQKQYEGVVDIGYARLYNKRLADSVPFNVKHVPKLKEITMRYVLAVTARRAKAAPLTQGDLPWETYEKCYDLPAFENGKIYAQASMSIMIGRIKNQMQLLNRAMTIINTDDRARARLRFRMNRDILGLR